MFSSPPMLKSEETTGFKGSSQNDTMGCCFQGGLELVLPPRHSSVLIQQQQKVVCLGARTIGRLQKNSMTFFIDPDPAVMEICKYFFRIRVL